MNSRFSNLIPMSLLLGFLSSSCGDIIRVPKKQKDLGTIIPEENTSAQLGRCANFTGRWTAICEQPTKDLPNDFELMQQSCELFNVLPEVASFNLNASNDPGSASQQSVNWSESHKDVTLTQVNKAAGNLQTIFHFRMIDGRREGIWSRQDDAGAQSCSLQWSNGH